MAARVSSKLSETKEASKAAITGAASLEVVATASGQLAQGDAWRSVRFDRFLTTEQPGAAGPAEGGGPEDRGGAARHAERALRGGQRTSQRTAASQYAEATTAWHQEIVNEIATAEAALPRERRHLIAYNTDYAETAGIGPVPVGISVLNFHYLNRLKPVLAAYGLQKALGYDETRSVAHDRFPEYRITMKPAAGRVRPGSSLSAAARSYSNLNHAYQVDDPAVLRVMAASPPTRL